MLKLRLEKLNKSHWLSAIGIGRQRIMSCRPNTIVELSISDEISPRNIEPWHIVSLACLIELSSKHVSKFSLIAGEELHEFFKNNLHLDKYFSKNSHVESESNTILNLWKINTKESLFYSSRLSTYLKQTYFKGKDISMLKLMLDELYANVADHSHSEDIAYSFIQYYPERNIISVAFCDFGIGIPSSLKQNGKHPILRRDYIKYATQRGITVKSSIHNSGFGLATVLDCMENSNHYLRIISNDELYYHLNFNGQINEKTFLLNQPFDGTLIYYDIDISQFQSEEILGIGDLINDIDW